MTAQLLLLLWLPLISKDYSEIGQIVEDCKDYMFAIPLFNFRHIYREVNGVVYRLAHLASLSYIDDFWLGETSSIIKNIFFENIYKCSRDSDITPPRCMHRSLSINTIMLHLKK